MIFKSSLFPVVISTCLSTLLIPATARAQVSVSPLIIEAKADRGQAQGSITITNTGSTPSRVRVYAEPFTYKRDTGFQTLESTSPNNLTPYLQFSPRELAIEPGQSRRIRLISRLAPNLPDGEYRAVVFNETLTESKDTGGNRVSLVARIGVTVYVAKGKVAPKLEVDSASLNQEQKQVQLLVRNSGKASVRPNGIWTLRQGDTVVKTGNLDSTTVMAEGDRYILLNYPGKDQPALAAGDYDLGGELVWGEDNKSKMPFHVNFTIPSQTATQSQK